MSVGSSLSGADCVARDYGRVVATTKRWSDLSDTQRRLVVVGSAVSGHAVIQAMHCVQFSAM